MQHSGNRQHGFTLTETLTTLAVLGISLSLAIPGLESLAQDNARATAVNQLVATMHMARSEAITRNTPVAVCPSRDLRTCTENHWESGWIRFTDNNHNQILDAEELILGVSPPVPGFIIRSEAFARVLSYEPSGRVIAADNQRRSGEFSFCALGAEASAQVVIVNTVGEAALSARHANGSTPDCEDTQDS
jgi:type IV fimbrial biogenesis protein FimT